MWGGSSGIGAAVAARLIDDGHDVLVLSRRKPALACAWHPFDCDRPGEEVQRHVRRLIWGSGDHLAGEELDWYVDQSDWALPMRKRWRLERWGAPDLAVLSAGMGAYMLWNDWRDDTHDGRAGFDTLWRINAKSKACIAKELLLAMRRRRSGKVLVVGSRMAALGDHGAEAYAMAQGALRGFVASAHRHPARRGVTLALVEPGWVRTPMTEVLPDWKRAAAVRQFGEFLEPEDVARSMLGHEYTPGEIYGIE